MNKISYAFVICLLIIVMAGCGADNDGGPTSSPSGSSTISNEGAQLMGLTNNRNLYYMQIDTIISMDSVYHTDFDTSYYMISISGTSDDWIIRVDNQPMINLLVSDPYVLQNGYWSEINGRDSLRYFADPPIVMPQSIKKDDSWSGFTPFYQGDSEEYKRQFYNYYFGFYFTRTYTGTEEVILPSGVFDAVRIDVDLFLDKSSTTPEATVVEYYASGIGLVKLVWRGVSLKRTISLVEIH